ncbi:MAG TPA: response regulator, partial [Gammaproteobacteria bacterium]
VIATGIDITERRKTEKKLQQSETSLQAAQRIAKVGSWEMDAQTGKLWWSDENYRIFGLNPGQFEPSLEAYYESIHPDDLPTAKAAAIKLAEQGHIDIINRILLPSGEQRIVREIAETETDADGRPLVMRGTVHDITELKQSEEERNQLQRQLQQAQKMESIGHLTGGIAHDFNNILASILGFTQLAITRFAPNREGTLGNYLSEIEKGGKRASDLVKQMLAFSRGDTQGHTILNPHPILIESVKMLRSTIPSSITLNYKPPGFDIRIQTDALQLQQAVVNLIINARDSLEGKGRIEVIFKSAVINSVECSSCHKLFSGNYAGVFVKDNGSGIAKEIIPRIFEPFFTTKKIGQGSGMGLALVHGFVHASGGHVGIETGIDSGTTMKLYFPLCDFDTDSSHGNASPLFGDSLARNGDTIKILVVDDEEAIVKLVSEILEIHNYQVVSTTSSKQALKTLTDSPDEFAVLVTDQAMPDLSGVDLIHEIRKNNTKIPIIICTGYSDIVNEFNFAEKGASRFLAKPVWHDELLKVVSELIDGLKTH